MLKYILPIKVKQQWGQSRRHGGALVGLAPQTKLQAPSN